MGTQRLGCLFSAASITYLLASRRTFLIRISLSCSRQSISEINSSKRFESCPSVASTQSRIQCSRFSPSILPSAVRWQQRRANRSDAHCQRLLFRSSMAALPPLKNARTPCKTTKCLRHISLGLNFGGVRRHFGLPLQSSNLIGDFRSVALIRNLCCRFQRLIYGR